MFKIYSSFFYFSIANVLLGNSNEINTKELPIDTYVADKISKENKGRYLTINNDLINISANPFDTIDGGKFSKWSQVAVKQYENLDTMEKKLVDCLFNKNKENVQVTFYKNKTLEFLKKNKFKKHNGTDNFTIHLPGTDQHYSFEWKEREFNQLFPLERKIAKYYGGEENSKIEFLYFYGTNKKNHPSFVQKPWAIKINNQTHATIWVKPSIEPIEDEKIDIFLRLPDNIPNEQVDVLIDENSNIIAKRIDRKVEFKDKTKSHEETPIIHTEDQKLKSKDEKDIETTVLKDVNELEKKVNVIKDGLSNAIEEPKTELIEDKKSDETSIAHVAEEPEIAPAEEKKLDETPVTNAAEEQKSEPNNDQTTTNNKKSGSRYIAINNELENISANSTSNEKFDKYSIIESVIYSNLDNLEKKLIDCLFNKNEQKNQINITFYGNNTNRGSREENRKKLMIHIPGTDQGYSFIWKSMAFNRLLDFEKQIVQYYGGDNKSKIKFLYPYKKNEIEPWAVKIDDIAHVIIRVKTSIQPLEDSKEVDPFLIIHDDTVSNDNISIFIDENSSVIAKYIDKKLEFNDKFRGIESVVPHASITQETKSEQPQSSEQLPGSASN